MFHQLLLQLSPHHPGVLGSILHLNTPCTKSGNILENMCNEQYFMNTCRFLAGITMAIAGNSRGKLLETFAILYNIYIYIYIYIYMHCAQ